MTITKLSPFDFLKSINDTKKNIMELPEHEKMYVPFVTNRSLSYFPDTVLLANEMNRYHHIDSKLQYQFLINIVRKRKRFSKWVKPEIENDIESVKEYYGYSNDKARQVLSLLSSEQLTIIRDKVNKGGRK
mgnify:FL=1|jgi:hypothetical protein|tara:strand:+ start:382 stop:774 length:393 start_codon:yes stop_codon:yes gene_type:complete